ncbi:MAG: RNA-guided endonuclease InsQ/TnpB family protein, partial [Mycobacterium sp.]
NGDGVADDEVTGLSWRSQVCQQVFEEAAVDLGRALRAWSQSRAGTRTGTRVGFPRFKKKTATMPSFRLRNKHTTARRSAILVAAHLDGTEVARITEAPRALAAGMTKQRRLAKSLSRTQRGSRNRRDAAARLRRHHHHVANVRRHFLHQVANALVKTHDRLVLEDLHVTGMLANHRLAQAISDAGWTEFARIVGYKQTWRHGTVTLADRWYPSSKRCSHCGIIRSGLTLADRVFTCSCGYCADRDTNAAVNLALWGQKHHHDSPSDPRTPKQRGRATNARRRDGTDQHPTRAGEPARTTREPTFTPPPRPEPTERPRTAVPTRQLVDTL